MNFTAAQHAAIHLAANLVVTAGAGSGKTRVLVERYLRLFGDHGADAVLAITFTEKAAREMRDRVRRTVEERARAAAPADRPLWEERRAAIEAARVGTIHSFCAALLRAHPAETGLDPHFTVLDEIEAGLRLAVSVDAALQVAVDAGRAPAGAAPAGDERFAALLAEFGLDELRAILTEMLLGGGEVRAALAGLPTDADTLIAEWRDRLAAAQAEAQAEALSSPAWQAAAATMLRLAAGAPGADRIGAQVGAVAAWLAGPGSAPPIDDWGPITAINLTGGSKKSWGGEADLQAAKAALRTLRESYSASATLLELVLDHELEQRAARAILGLRDLYRLALADYTARKEEQDALDFDDLERRARELLEQHPAVRARWQTELRAVLVDEFQDTNDEQRAIIYALTGLAAPDAGAPPAADSPALFVVGDGKQSIYRFRGADVSVFRAVAAQVMAQGGQAVALDTSFRAHPPLVSWVNQVTQAVFARPGALRPYEFPFEPLRPHRSAPPHDCCVELHIVAAAASADARRAAEAEALAARIAALVEGACGPLVTDGAGWRTPHYGDFALLFQASTVFPFYEQALRAAGIPYLTTAGRGYYGRKEVVDLINLLRVLDDPADELALVGVLRSPLFAIDDGAILRLRLANSHSLWQALDAAPNDCAAAPLEFARATLRELHALRGRVTVVELLRAGLAATGYLATISSLADGDRRRVNVEKLIEAARVAGKKGLGDFRDYLEKLLEAEPREGEAPLEAFGSVQLMTVHRSKGLEFPIVVLPDLGRRGVSSTAAWLARRSYGPALALRGPAGDPERPCAYHLALAEEQRMERAERERLLYVALTRAQDYLLLSGAAAKNSGPDWLSRLVAALGYPWESGGPPPGASPPLHVFHAAYRPNGDDMPRAST